MYPALCLDVEADDRLSNLQDGHFDAAIRLGPLADSSLIARPVTVNRHLICAAGYLERRGTPVHPDDLPQHDGLLYLNREPHGMWSLPLEYEKQSFRVRVRMRTDSGFQLLAGAVAGLPLSCRPSWRLKRWYPASRVGVTGICAVRRAGQRRLSQDGSHVAQDPGAGPVPGGRDRPSGPLGRAADRTRPASASFAYLNRPSRRRRGGAHDGRPRAFGKANHRFGFRYYPVAPTVLGTRIQWRKRLP